MFGGADIDDLEVFGSDAKNPASENIDESTNVVSDMDISGGEIAQFDGGIDSDSSDESGGLVINEGESVDDNPVDKKEESSAPEADNPASRKPAQRRSRRTAAAKSTAVVKPHTPRASRRRANNQKNDGNHTAESVGKSKDSSDSDTVTAASSKIEKPPIQPQQVKKVI